MTDLFDQLKVAMTMTDNLVSKLRAGGCHELIITSALMNTAGVIFRQNITDQKARRRIVLHAAEVIITGREQPLEG